jgi:hypothetical protein
MKNLTIADAINDGIAFGAVMCTTIITLGVFVLLSTAIFIMVYGSCKYTFEVSKKLNRTINTEELSHCLSDRKRMLEFDLDLYIEKCTEEPDRMYIIKTWASAIFIGIGIAWSLYYIMYYPLFILATAYVGEMHFPV